MFGRRFFASSRIGVSALSITVVNFLVSAFPETYIFAASLWKPQRGASRGSEGTSSSIALFFSTEDTRKEGYLFQQGREGGDLHKRQAGFDLSFTFRFWGGGIFGQGASSVERWRRKKDLEIP